MGVWKDANNKQILINSSLLLEYVNNREVWFGKKTVQTETDWAEESSLTPFTAISGNGIFGIDEGDEAQIIGTGDTPLFTSQTHFKVFRIAITNSSETSPYAFRIVFGKGTIEDAIAAEQYTGLILTYDNFASVPFNIILPQLKNGYKIWLQCKNAVDNATISFFVGVFGIELS